MAKDKFYFSHDSNARGDDKTVALRMKLGWEGYGLFWAIIEKLRECENYTSVCDYNVIAYDLRSDSAKIKSIINDFGLFSFTECGKCFYSESLKRRMDIKEEISQKRSQAAHERWNKSKEESNSNANALQKQTKSNAINGKKSKVKESKEKEEIVSDETQTQPILSDDSFIKFQAWLLDKAPAVTKMKEPFTQEQFLKLKEKCTSEEIMSLCLKMHNWKLLNQKNNSAYYTFTNWYNRGNN
ncbi:DUF4373 domain-containing protein [Taibaiella lutea]|uniref:DUF4373 domain-containing protein n=1 Tax=Taibaiella lutea TaxID=2608001 RepID=A0A5M6CCG4_9BACT|nr:Lin1244/Lin1753 domain-containing protein [Taibaiella lutea]KAA5532683.1 DUF4373 domain-containing protein [Taibaiella lutea]